MVEHPTTDGRRALGEQTRQRLLEATRVLVAERGEDAVTLRDITQAASANVAAASYHFGSLAALRRAAIEQAIETLIDSQIEGFRALEDDAGLEQIAAAFAQPLIAAYTNPECAEQASLRIMARIAPTPPPELEEWIRATIARADAELFPRLRRALPGVTDEDLQFRIQAVAGIIQHLVNGRMRVGMHDRSASELERLLIPAITGVLTAGDRNPASRRSEPVRRSAARA